MQEEERHNKNIELDKEIALVVIPLSSTYPQGNINSQFFIIIELLQPLTHSILKETLIFSFVLVIVLLHCVTGPCVQDCDFRSHQDTDPKD